MDNGEHRGESRTVIGPTVTVALPFSKITKSDPDLRDAVSLLAGLVSRLAAAQAGDANATEMRDIRAAADGLVTRLAAQS
jgi:hypothetical protein